MSPDKPDAPAPEQASEHHDELHNLRAFVEEHGMKLAIAICVVIAAATSVSFYQNRRQTRADEATQSLAEATSVAQLEDIAGKYDGSPVAQLALLRLAKSHYNLGSFDLAIQKYDEFLSRFADHPMADVARMGRIECLEATGRTEEALDQFEAFAKSNPGHFLAPQALLGQSRCLQTLGRKDAAKAVCDEFIVNNPDNPWIPRFEEQLENIGGSAEEEAPVLPAP